MTRFNRKQIYTTAAERISDRMNTYSCVALEEASPVDEYGCSTNQAILEIERYGSTFSPGDERRLFWLRYYAFDEDSHEGAREAREWRLTALCFAAAMTEAEMAPITKVVHD